MAVVDPSSIGCPNGNRDRAAAMLVAQCDINGSALLLSGWVRSVQEYVANIATRSMSINFLKQEVENVKTMLSHRKLYSTLAIACKAAGLPVRRAWQAQRNCEGGTCTLTFSDPE